MDILTSYNYIENIEAAQACIHIRARDTKIAFMLYLYLNEASVTAHTFCIFYLVDAV